MPRPPAKVTFLIGAGASAKAVPVVTGFAEGLRQLESRLRGDFAKGYEFGHDLRISLANELKALHGELSVILTNGGGKTEERLLHSSIDTYAKKIYIQEKDNPPGDHAHSRLSKLKVLVSLYLTYEQSRGHDVRYDSFFASILKETANALPDNIRILSWNYDSQFELSYNSFRINGTLESAAEKLNIKSKYTHHTKSDSSGFSIYKINGTANFRNGEIDRIIIKPRGVNQPFQTVLSLYQEYLKDPNKLVSGISFAWEEEVVRGGNPHARSIVERAIDDVKDTEIIVIIGYSFPLFNRTIDSRLFQAMDGLTKIYIQDKRPDIIRQRLMSFTDEDGTTCELTDDIDQFVFPAELTI